MRFVYLIIANACAFLFTDWLVPGIELDNFLTAIFAALVLGFLNTFLRPILQLLALPVTFLTLGLFSWVISGAILWLTSVFVPGFEVDGFLSAVVGGVVLAFVATILQSLVKRVA